MNLMLLIMPLHMYWCQLKASEVDVWRKNEIQWVIAVVGVSALNSSDLIVPDIAIFVLKMDVKL